MQDIYSTNSAGTSAIDTSKVLRNTYALLSMTLVVSAIAAGLSMALNLGYGLALVFNLSALGMLFFMRKWANSSKGIIMVFAFVSLLGAGLGPMLTRYMGLPNGGMLIMQAMGATALVFFALSGYVLTTGKNFSFMGGFLFVGLIVVLVAIVGSFVASLFGMQITGLSLAISAVIVLLMSGFILYDTSQIIHGGETNYIMATVSLYLDILNLFTSLLHLIGFLGNDD